MPKKTAVIVYDKCDPQLCDGGECSAVRECDMAVLKQEEAFEKPDFPIICIGCGKCVRACMQGAVILMWIYLKGVCA